MIQSKSCYKVSDKVQYTRYLLIISNNKIPCKYKGRVYLVSCSITYILSLGHVFNVIVLTYNNNNCTPPGNISVIK